MPKVSTYPSASLPLTGSESAYVVQSGNSRKVALSDIFGPKLQTAQAMSGLTLVEFTGIPSWANRVVVMGRGLALGGTNRVTLQLGNGSIVSTGYLGATSQIVGATPTSINFTNAAALTESNSAASVFRFHATVARQNGNNWLIDGGASFSNTTATVRFTYDLALAGVMDRLRINAGGDTFGGGSINISWE